MVSTEQLIGVIEAELAGRASTMLIARLRHMLARATNPDELDAILGNVRVALRLFVDERLADQVDARLRQVTGLKRPDESPKRSTRR